MSPVVSEASPERWDDETDVLVIGSGAGGLSAALFAAQAGLRVLICEKLAYVGGTTATSGGGIWVPGTKAGLAAGDTLEAARTYLKALLGDFYQEEVIDTYLATGGKVIDFLNENTEVKFDLSSWPDYRSSLPGGATRGRSLFPQPFDGKKLGRNFSLLHPPLHRLMVLGGLMLGPEEVHDFLRPFSSPRALMRVLRKLLRYGMDRIRYARGTDLRSGNALAARLLYSVDKLGCRILTQADLESLAIDHDRVIGATVVVGGVPKRIRASKAVLLATGGFAHNQEMLRRYGPATPHRFSLCNPACTGAGIQAALDAGASVDRALSSVGFWTPASASREKNGADTPVIYGYLDRGRPGVIAVNEQGKRFVNEADSYHDIVSAIFANGGADGRPFHFITDRAFVRRHGLGLIRPWPWNRSLRPWIRRGYITVASTLDKLGPKIGIDPGALAAAVQRHNQSARTGQDPDFHKGASAYNRMFGHNMTWPNPNLAPIETPPFVALRIHPATIGTAMGLKTSASGQALNAAGQPISGPYACGNDRASPFRGFYPGGGSTLGPAIVGAYLAVQSLSKP
ncbi:FAD-dependent oxidoreductase [Bordetella bronchiseptica]|uniref:FAD-dependent oxidoreductase n=1 Tax=Bordetella bronchiseptica TaxID=518 RepID=UPI000E3C9B1D|nr:FAD-dependent oxidoreductase [Bordetella bronchiseptica]RFT75621.1 FAD-dependent oxidoreductase [Bordetella bronchiseptica]